MGCIPKVVPDRSIFQAFPRPLKGWKKNEDGFHSPFSRLSLFPPLDILFVSVLQVSWAELPHREYYFSLSKIKIIIIFIILRQKVQGHRNKYYFLNNMLLEKKRLKQPLCVNSIKVLHSHSFPSISSPGGDNHFTVCVCIFPDIYNFFL